MRPMQLGAGLLVALAVAACADDPDRAVDRDTMSQAQRDSLVGASSLPGARGVSGALAGSDSAAARAARIEAESQP